MTGTAASERVDAVFAALSDPTRRELLDVLAETGGATQSRLAAGLPITRQAVSRHLAVLEEAGLARSSVSGRERRYAVAPEGLAAAEAWIARAEQRWAGRLHALKAYVEAGEHIGEALGLEESGGPDRLKVQPLDETEGVRCE